MVSVCVVPVVPVVPGSGQLCPKGVCHNEIVISFSCGGNNNNNSCNCPATNKLWGMLRISRHNFISLPQCSHPLPLVIVALMCSAVLDLVCALWLCNLWAWGARGCISVAVIIMFFIRFFVIFILFSFFVGQNWRQFRVQLKRGTAYRLWISLKQNFQHLLYALFSSLLMCGNFKRIFTLLITTFAEITPAACDITFCRA